jgi:hypothetical protein
LYIISELAAAELHGGDAVTTKMLQAGSSEAPAGAETSETSETKDEAAGKSDDASAEASGKGSMGALDQREHVLNALDQREHILNALDPVGTPERDREREEFIDNQPDGLRALDATFTDPKTGIYPPPHMTCMYPPPLLTCNFHRL